ncbi:MAG: DUF547 domain-containing protein [Myxacorys californica WJT36-NPBG1]|nr:DUF547 domain-containing protein [Myxacorys californica WJT36-NPBG1]
MSQISTLELKSQSVDEQLALWINLYNAFTIDKILERYPIRLIQSIILGLPNWFTFLWFFMHRNHSMFDQQYRLAQIENRTL